MKVDNGKIRRQSTTRIKIASLWNRFGKLIKDRRIGALAYPIVLIVGGVLGELGHFVWTEYVQPQDIYLTVFVSDAESPFTPLEKATVGLQLKASGYHSGVTDANGKAGITIPHRDRGETVTPEVSLQGYTLPSGKPLAPIALGATTLISQISLQRVKKADSSPVESPPNQLTKEVYKSDNLPSGAGRNFSQFYTLCSPEKPQGWTIVDANFNLTGDRSCNAWAQCVQTESSETKVCWKFSMQGHDEQVGVFSGGNTGIQFSAGVLTVIWKH